MIHIKTDEELVTVIDELKHNLKSGIPYSPMKAEFNAMLNAFIAKWKLDSDPHAFAATPEEAQHQSNPFERMERTVITRGRFSQCVSDHRHVTAKPPVVFDHMSPGYPLWPGMFTGLGIFPESGHFVVFITNVDAETTAWWKARKTGESVWVPLYGRHDIVRVYLHEELNGCCKRIDIEVKRHGEDRAFANGVELPRTPQGHEGAGYINNCALANGEDEASCQMCGGSCPDRHRFAKEPA